MNMEVSVWKSSDGWHSSVVVNGHKCLSQVFTSEREAEQKTLFSLQQEVLRMQANLEVAPLREIPKTPVQKAAERGFNR